MGVFLLILFVFLRSFRFGLTPFYPSLHFHSPPSVRFQFFMNVSVRVDFFGRWIFRTDIGPITPRSGIGVLFHFLIAVFFGGFGTALHNNFLIIGGSLVIFSLFFFLSFFLYVSMGSFASSYRLWKSVGFNLVIFE